MVSKKLARQLSKFFQTEDPSEVLAQLDVLHQGSSSAQVITEMKEKWLDFLQVVDRTYEQSEVNLEIARHSLEVSSKEVEERNKDLRLQNRKISDLLHNLKQSVFMVDASECIAAPLSRHTDIIFEQSILNRRVHEVVFSDFAPHSEELQRIETVFSSVFGEEDYQWEEMAHLLPQRVTRNQGQQILQITYNPIWDEQSKLSRIMFVIEDITDLVQLNATVERERERSERTVAMVQEFLRHDREHLIPFMTQQAGLLQAVIQSVAVLNDETIVAFKRNLHTLKGNFRMFGIVLMARACHDIEVHMRKDPKTPDLPDMINGLRKTFQEYVELMSRLYGTRIEFLDGELTTQESSLVSVPRTILNQVLSLFNDARHYFPSTLQMSLFRAVDRLQFVPLTSRFSSVAPMVQELARAIDKDVEVEIQADDTCLPPQATDLVYNCLVQILRNAVDHGLEETEERLSRGKSPRNRIKISWQSHEDESFTLSVRDDGAGVDTDRVVAKACELGLITEAMAQHLTKQQKLELIMLPGFSVRSTLTESSGMGMGMDIVQTNVRELKGTLLVHSELGEGTQITLKMPAQPYFRWAIPAQNLARAW